MNHLEFLLFAGIVAFSCGALIELWSFCLGDPMQGAVSDGRVFSSWGRAFLTRYQDKEDRREVRNAALRAQFVQDLRERHRMKNPGKPFVPTEEDMHGAPRDMRPNWWKITGVCPKCTVVWFAFAVYAGMVPALAPSPWWWFGIFNFAGMAFVGLEIAHRTRG